MATKLTKAFAEFVGGRGFLIANEGEISQQPGEDYKLGLCGDSPLKNARLLGFRAASGDCLKIRDERSDLSSRFLRH